MVIKIVLNIQNRWNDNIIEFIYVFIQLKISLYGKNFLAKYGGVNWDGGKFGTSQHQHLGQFGTHLKIEPSIETFWSLIIP